MMYFPSFLPFPPTFLLILVLFLTSLSFLISSQKDEETSDLESTRQQLVGTVKSITKGQLRFLKYGTILTFSNAPYKRRNGIRLC